MMPFKAVLPVWILNIGRTRIRDVHAYPGYNIHQCQCNLVVVNDVPAYLHKN